MTSLSRFQVVCESVKISHHRQVLLLSKVLLCFIDALVVQFREDRAEFLVLRELCVLIAEPAKVVERECKLGHCIDIGFPVLDKLIVGFVDCILVALVLADHRYREIGDKSVLTVTGNHTVCQKVLEVLFYTG